MMRFERLTKPVEWIGTPKEWGWYWWRENEEKAPMPVFVGKGPFGNNCFKPGLGWCLKDRIGGEWCHDRIPYPDEVTPDD